MTRYLWPFLIAAVPHLAHADVVIPQSETVEAAMGEAAGAYGSTRNVAEDFMVLPYGLDLGAHVRTVTADDGLGVGKLKLTDVALFDVAASWAIAKHYELDASGTLLAKQPSTTDEPVVQSGSIALRRELPHRFAVALAGSASALVNLHGDALGASATLAHKHRLNEIITFGLSVGADGVAIRNTNVDAVATRGAVTDADRPWLVEVGGHASVLARVPNGVWGGWIDVGYAVPVAHGGMDPVSEMPLDPQPRFDITLGTAVQLAEQWDLSFTIAVLDRGDATNPATELPILDDGFDQIQLMLGVSRRFGHEDPQALALRAPMAE
ncbi:MAG TPA: hypothetical protein VGG74_30050 [Kofleriaceae bacterium]|jgi:hypothetical protein